METKEEEVIRYRTLMKNAMERENYKSAIQLGVLMRQSYEFCEDSDILNLAKV